MHVHIVDDSHDLADLLRLQLVHAGHRVTATVAGFDRLLTPEPWRGVDAAIVDLMLGERTTGVDILGYLAEHQPHVRRVCLSAVAGLMPADAHVTLRKPSPVDAILAAVEEA